MSVSDRLRIQQEKCFGKLTDSAKKKRGRPPKNPEDGDGDEEKEEEETKVAGEKEREQEGGGEKAVDGGAGADGKAAPAQSSSTAPATEEKGKEKEKEKDSKTPTREHMEKKIEKLSKVRQLKKFFLKIILPRSILDVRVQILIWF